ncbi:MAG: CubicO group peptidase (beta-lactamase class C family) [Arenicella sp.]|jgi:CubicO group peptidase (beta-lactamase class C family)
MLKVITKILGVLLVAVIVVLVLKWESAKRLYDVTTLFDEDKIVTNFSSMKDIFNSVEIQSDSEPYFFAYKAQALPEQFQYKNNTVVTKEFLERTATTALVVLRDETITHESYYLGTHAQDRRISWSVAKSFLSALMGVAVEQGKIENINDLVTKYVPSLETSGYASVTIKNVLQMSSGVAFDEDYKRFSSDINRMGRLMALGGSFDDFARSLTKEREQGTFMHYVSIDTHVLGMVLRAATGEPIVDYFKTHLWDKIQPEASTYYITDDTGEPMVLGGLTMRSRDYLKIGKLFRDGGRWNAAQVIPESWVQQSVTPEAPHLMPGKRDTADTNLGYGYQWWLPENADQEFMALGIYDQFVYIDKKSNIVIVKNSANIDFTDNNYESTDESVAFFRSVVKHLLDNP